MSQLETKLLRLPSARGFGGSIDGDTTQRTMSLFGTLFAPLFDGFCGRNSYLSYTVLCVVGLVTWHTIWQLV